MKRIGILSMASTQTNSASGSGLDEFDHMAIHCSPAKILRSAEELRLRHFDHSRWVSKHNHYAHNTIERLRDDLKSHAGIRTGQMAHYVTSSVVLHCFDGWNYLARAVDCRLNGDFASAVHLAYYAELRAAMAFLASEGIGVFDKKHLWFDEQEHCQIFQQAVSTHQFVWRAIQHWASVSHKSRGLLRLFSVSQVAFDQWFQAASNVASLPPWNILAEEWLADWSLDLKVVEQDRSARNYVSYRSMPNSQFTNVSPDALFRKLFDFWRACEPSTAGSFGILDMHLLRRGLHRLYGMISTGTSLARPTYSEFIHNTLAVLSIGESSLKSFLLKRSGPARHPLLVEADSKSGLPLGRLRPMSVVARALLMLRLATAAAANLLRRGGIMLEKVGFWWSRLGEEAGLWEPGYAPDEMADLWADIQANIDTIEEWLSQEPSQGQNSSLLAIRRANALDVWQLGQFQRAGLWALAV